MIRLDCELHVLASVDPASKVAIAHQRRIYSKIAADDPLSRFLLYVQRHTCGDIGSLIKNSTVVVSGYVRIWYRGRWRSGHWVWRWMGCRCFSRLGDRPHSRYRSRNYGHSGSDYRLRRGCRFNFWMRCGCGNMSWIGCGGWKSGYSGNSRVSTRGWCE